LFKKLKQLEKLNGRLAMFGLAYLSLSKLLSNLPEILNQLKLFIILKQ
tara:strand:+ start:510 stop:653 length:144 start_codon:yes stop_codon:yes gene_type:complete